MTELEKELMAALKEHHEIIAKDRLWHKQLGKECGTCQLIAKAEAQEAGDE